MMLLYSTENVLNWDNQSRRLGNGVDPRESAIRTLCLNKLTTISSRVRGGTSFECSVETSFNSSVRVRLRSS